MKRTFLVAGISIAVVFGAGRAILLELTSSPPTPGPPVLASPPPPPAAVGAAREPSSPPSPSVAVAAALPGPPVTARFKGGKLYPSATRLRANAQRQGET